MPAHGVARTDVLRLAGALESASEHPVGRAVAAAATAELGPLPQVHDFANVDGLGVQGVVDGPGDATYAVVVGRPALLAEWSQPLPTELTDALDEAEADGRTVVAVGWDGAARGLLVVADTVKPTSAAGSAAAARPRPAPPAAHR